MFFYYDYQKWFSTNLVVSYQKKLLFFDYKEFNDILTEAPFKGIDFHLLTLVEFFVFQTQITMVNVQVFVAQFPF